MILPCATQWKEKYKELETEARAAMESKKSTDAMIPKLVEDWKRAKDDFEQAKLKLEDLKESKKAKEAEHEAKVLDLEFALKEKALTATQAKETLARLASEIDILKITIKDRETSIVGLEAKVKEIRSTATYFEGIAKNRQIQNENLLETVRTLSKEVARLEAGVGGASGGAPTVSNPNEARPSALQINGKIELVEGSFVQLTVGTDHGLQKNNTMEVFRLQPVPKYLGMIRIIDAKAHKSVGQLIPTSLAAPQLREGDYVTSKLTK